MRGLDNMQVQVNPLPEFDIAERELQGAQSLCAQLTDGSKVLAVSAGSELLSDYERSWFVVVHVVSFPNGTGKMHCEHEQCCVWWSSGDITVRLHVDCIGSMPEGMSLATYGQALLQSYPRRQYAQNVRLVLDLWNVSARHQVNTQANVQLRFTPSLLRKVCI